MSNQCSTFLFKYRTCSPFAQPHTPLKPFATTLRPVFSFRSSLILIGRRSRNRASSLLPPLAAQSSSDSDIVLIETTQHNDGSLVFRFGDASEVVKYEKVVEEIESISELESNNVKVLDGDHVKQVSVETIDRGYGSDGGSITEVADGIRIVDADVAKSETNLISGLRDFYEASERLSQISKGEALPSQSDYKFNNSLQGLESTLDKSESKAQLDGDESLNPTIPLLDDSLNRDKSAKPGEMLFKDSDDKTESPSVSINLESMQALGTTVMNVKQPYAKDELHNIETKDTSISDIKILGPPETMCIPDVELKDAAYESVEAELQDINVNEGTLIDEMPQSDPLEIKPIVDVVNQLQSVHVKGDATTEVSSVKAVDVKDQTLEDELQQASMQVSDIELEEAIDKNLDDVKAVDVKDQALEDELQQVSMQVSDIELDNAIDKNLDDVKAVDVKDQALEDELQQVSMQVSDLELEDAIDKNLDHANAVDVKVEALEDELRQVSMEVSEIELEYAIDKNLYDVKVVDVEDQALEDDLQQVSMQVSDIELEDAIDKNLNDGVLQAIEKTEDSLVTVKLEYISDGEAMDVTKPYSEFDLHKVEPEDTRTSDKKDLMTPATMSTSDIEHRMATNDEVNEGLQDMNISEGTLIDGMPPSNPSGAKLTLDEVTKLQSAYVKLQIMEVITTDNMDVKDQPVENKLQEVSTTNEDENDVAYMMPVSGVEEEEPILEEELSDPESTPIGLDPTIQVLITDNIDVVDQPVENKLQQVSTNNGDENDIAYVMPVSGVEEEEPFPENKLSEPQSTPLELNTTILVSDIELQDTMGQNLDGVLQIIDKTDDPSVYVKLETMQASHAEVVDVTQISAKDELRKVETEDTSQSNMTDLMLPATMHVSDVELPVAANEVVEDGLLDININDGTLLEEMPTSNALGTEPTFDEPSQLKLEATKEVPDTKGMDGVDQAVEDELQQVSTDNGFENNLSFAISAEPFLKEEASQLRSTPIELKPPMQVEDCTVQNVDEEILQVINDVAGDSYIKNINMPSDQLEAQPVQDEGLNYSMMEQHTETDALGSSPLLEQSANGSQLEAEGMEGIVSSSELFESSENSAILLTAETIAEREKMHLTGYFLSSGAALLKHPSKALAGGDDAYFVAGSKWLGVADRVSQWSFEVTDPGVYAQALMRTCEEIVLDTRGLPVTNPVELLCRGVKETKMSGSSNVLIANFDGQALHVANIGDTGFLIIRHGAVYKKSSPLLHEFHFALQVENSDDPLQLAEEHKIELDEGDVVVYATDGLFDNLYEREIAMIILKLLQTGMKPEVNINAFSCSPFSDFSTFIVLEMVPYIPMVFGAS